MWHPNDVIRSVLLPYIRFNRKMMLAKDNTPYHADRSTQVILVTNNVEHSNGLHKIWTSIQASTCETYWSAMCVHSRCNQISARSRVLLIRCAIIQQFLHRYIISLGTMYIAVIATAGGHTKYWNEIK